MSNVRAIRYLVYDATARGVIYRLINGKLLGEAKVTQLRVCEYAKQFDLLLAPAAKFDLLTTH